MSKRAKVILAITIPSVLLVLLGIIFGSEGQNTDYKPQNEFRLDSWISLPGPFDINKAVLYLFIASFLTVVTMLYIANRMQAKPNRTRPRSRSPTASCATTSPRATCRARWRASGSRSSARCSSSSGGRT